MLQDTYTIIWKELRELLIAGDVRGRSKYSLLILIGVFGIFFPLQFGPQWVLSPMSILPWAWVPFLLVSTVVADAFAGERERHTLETLLASRLSDRAILFGKLAAATIYGCGLTWIMALISLVTINVAFAADQGILLFSSQLAAGVVIFPLLVSVLSSSAGVLISLRASSVRQAQQTMSAVIFLIFIPIFAVQLLPATWQARFQQALLQTNAGAIAGAAALVLVILDIILIILAMARFQRNRLILD